MVTVCGTNYVFVIVGGGFDSCEASFYATTPERAAGQAEKHRMAIGATGMRLIGTRFNGAFTPLVPDDELPEDIRADVEDRRSRLVRARNRRAVVR